MPIRKDDRYRNLIGGHLRTCTCTECVRRRLGPPIKPQQLPKTEHSDQDWQDFVDEINQVDVSNEIQSQRKQLNFVRHFPAEIRERNAKAIEEERQSVMERKRQAENRPSPKSTAPNPKAIEEKREARMEPNVKQVLALAQNRRLRIRKP